MNMKKILIVDDDKDFCFCIKDRLLSEGFSCLTATTKSEAMDLFKSKPNLVMLDVCFGDTDGFEVCKEMKMQDKNIPIIMVTGFKIADIYNKSVDCGSEGFLTKSYELESFINTIRKIV